MDKQPEKLETALSVLDSLDGDERVQMLLDFSDRFKPVPETIARRPFPESNRVPYCESDAFVWMAAAPEGTVKLYFAVENPSGVSARALAYLLDRTLSGLKSRGSPEDFSGDCFPDFPPEHFHGQRYGADGHGAGRPNFGPAVGEAEGVATNYTNGHE